MPSEAASEKVGRRPVFSDGTLRQAGAFSYARQVGTRRGAQDLVYRMFAVAAIELYCEAHPKKASQLNWLLTPKRRHVLLSELGRIARPRTDAKGNFRWVDSDVDRLIHAALEISERKPTTKDGVALIREFRRRARAAAKPAESVGVPNARPRAASDGRSSPTPRQRRRQGARGSGRLKE
jgi:hypothetical protein